MRLITRGQETHQDIRLPVMGRGGKYGGLMDLPLVSLCKVFWESRDGPGQNPSSWPVFKACYRCVFKLYTLELGAHSLPLYVTCTFLSPPKRGLRVLTVIVCAFSPANLLPLHQRAQGWDDPLP